MYSCGKQTYRRGKKYEWMNNAVAKGLSSRRIMQTNDEQWKKTATSNIPLQQAGFCFFSL